MPDQSGAIFLNYRRADATPSALLLKSRLDERFPGVRVFMDLDSIEPGVDYGAVIEQAIGSSVVLLAVIGRQWLTTADARGRRRLDDPDDLLCREIRLAFDLGVRVIPVLVDGAAMPEATALPGSLERLTRLNAIELSNSRYSYDSGRLFRVIDHLLPAPGAAQASEPILVPAAKVPDPVGEPAISAAARQSADRTRRVLLAQTAGLLAALERKRRADVDSGSADPPEPEISDAELAAELSSGNRALPSR